MTRRPHRLALATLVLLLCCSCARNPWPDTLLEVAPGLTLAIRIPPGKWRVAAQAPGFLVEEMAGHVAHDLEEQGKAVDAAAIEAAVGQRLAANEQFVFNPVSGAHMEIDFSPLTAGETAPSRRIVADSARYAAESLISEEGVGAVDYQIRRARVPGADHAYSLAANYRKHESPTRFYGLIGFAGGGWFYLYFTDPGKDETDYPESQCMFRSARLLRGMSR